MQRLEKEVADLKLSVQRKQSQSALGTSSSSPTARAAWSCCHLEGKSKEEGKRHDKADLGQEDGELSPIAYSRHAATSQWLPRTRSSSRQSWRTMLQSPRVQQVYKGLVPRAARLHRVRNVGRGLRRWQIIVVLSKLVPSDPQSVGSLSRPLSSCLCEFEWFD